MLTTLSPRLRRGSRPLALLAAIAFALCAPGARLRAQQFGAAAPPPAPPPLSAGTKAPGIKSQTLSGQPFQLAALRGHVVVLDFWATWCVSCKQAMPSLDKLQKAYAARGVRVVGVSLDAPDTAKRVPATVKQLGVSYPILVGPKRNIAVGEAYNADVLPSLYVIDQSGTVRWSHAGVYDAEDKDVRTLIDHLLQQTERPTTPSRS